MTNKVIVVIGASRGIGKELVLQFAKEKSNTIIALSRNVEEMKRNFTSENIHCGFADISKIDLHKTLDETLDHYHHVDIVINNAGRLIKKPFLTLSREEIDECYQTNAIGTIHATQYFVPKMLQKGGHIVNISTMGAFQGSVKFPGLSAYSTSKVAISSFTEQFAEEFKNSKIRMNCLCLGAVQTEMFEEAFPGGKAPISASLMAEYIADFALNGTKFYNGKILPVSSSTP